METTPSSGTSDYVTIFVGPLKEVPDFKCLKTTVLTDAGWGRTLDIRSQSHIDEHAVPVYHVSSAIVVAIVLSIWIRYFGTKETQQCEFFC